MKQETIGTYTFGMGGTMPDTKDFFEVALTKIYEYEIEMGYPVFEGEPEVTYAIDDTLHITTPLFNYIVSDMMEHDEDSAENYCTFTLTKEITVDQIDVQPPVQMVVSEEDMDIIKKFLIK